MPGARAASPRLVDWAERGLVPDPLIRLGIRRMLRERLRQQAAGGREAQARRRAAFLEQIRRAPVALSPADPNRQHYEVPAAFFRHVLGARMKYSCAHFAPGVEGLDAAEASMLALTCQRAGIQDGMQVLDLGCGWGSLSLWIAEHFPRCDVLAVSNSKSQREHIDAECDRRGFGRVQVETADINHFETERRFDRIVSVEMFEHVRNHPLLLSRIARWLDPAGRLFVHIFCHREFAYPYESEGGNEWMARHFFTGGMMPSDDWLPSFQDDLLLEKRWRVSGLHYQRTCEAWLARLDAARTELSPILRAGYGAEEAERAFQRWRLFFLGCSELFGFRRGNEWWVSHFLLRRRFDGSLA